MTNYLPDTPTLILLGATLLALWVGARAPDIDLTPVLPLRHRSAWTHGALLPLAAQWCAAQWPEWSAVALAFCAGVALHLIDDLTPERWRGAALISLAPLRITLPAPLSWAWIFSGVIAAGWILI